MKLVRYKIAWLILLTAALILIAGCTSPPAPAVTATLAASPTSAPTKTPEPTQTLDPTETPTPASTATRHPYGNAIYWGAWLSSGSASAPWDTALIDAFESLAQK